MDALFEALLEARRAGRDAMLLTVVEASGSTPARPGGHLLLLDDGRALGTVGGGALETAAVDRGRDLMARGETACVHYALGDDDTVQAGEPTGMICGGAATLLLEYVGCGIRVIIYGAGHVGRAVAAVLAGQPLHVTLIDERPQPDPIPGANRVIVGPFASALADSPPAPGAYFVIVTPGHENDYAVLRQIMTSGWAPAYVGMIGSQRKSGAMVERLRTEAGEALPWDVLHTPVGLDLGGRTPAEIAISIAAEIQAVRYGRDGQRSMGMKDAK